MINGDGYGGRADGTGDDYSNGNSYGNGCNNRNGNGNGDGCGYSDGNGYGGFCTGMGDGDDDNDGNSPTLAMYDSDNNIPAMVRVSNLISTNI